MGHGIVTAIYIAQEAGGEMLAVNQVTAIAGKGLSGDRYSLGHGSWNRGNPGKRQVTLFNQRFLYRSGFTGVETRRNLITHGIELMDLIGREFRVGEAVLRGVKYCEPCGRPSKLAMKRRRFQHVFHDCGGLIAEVLESGLIQYGCGVVRST
jgi:MOSC domain-containing protein YiiM